MNAGALELPRARDWLRHFRTGDWLVIAAGIAGVAALYPAFWDGSHADRAIIRRDGELVAEVALATPRKVEVQGPLGVTVIEIASGRARVLSDPGPRQYCVQQGWLARANAIAICAPNHVSLMLRGRAGTHDSINY